MMRTVAARSRLSVPRLTYALAWAQRPPARTTGDRRRDRVARDEPSIDGRADRVHAQHILADPRQALAERRVDERPHQHEAEEQHGEGVEVLRPRIQRVELEHAEDRRD